MKERDRQRDARTDGHRDQRAKLGRAEMTLPSRNAWEPRSEHGWAVVQHSEGTQLPSRTTILKGSHGAVVRWLERY